MNAFSSPRESTPEPADAALVEETDDFVDGTPWDERAKRQVARKLYSKLQALSLTNPSQLVTHELVEEVAPIVGQSSAKVAAEFARAEKARELRQKFLRDHRLTREDTGQSHATNQRALDWIERQLVKAQARVDDARERGRADSERSHQQTVDELNARYTHFFGMLNPPAFPQPQGPDEDGIWRNRQCHYAGCFNRINDREQGFAGVCSECARTLELMSQPAVEATTERK